MLLLFLLNQFNRGIFMNEIRWFWFFCQIFSQVWLCVWLLCFVVLNKIKNDLPRCQSIREEICYECECKPCKRMGNSALSSIIQWNWVKELFSWWFVLVRMRVCEWKRELLLPTVGYHSYTKQKQFALGQQTLSWSGVWAVVASRLDFRTYE